MQRRWDAARAVDSDGSPIGELIRAAGIARRYYLDGASKIEIAAEFGLSRFQVARLLDKARDSGMVRIEIVAPRGVDPELSNALRSAYGLRQAIVVTAPGRTGDALRGSLGQAAAAYLTDLVGDGDVLGVACSRTLNAVTRSLTGLARCTVVQLTGALSGVAVEENSVEVLRRLASLAGGPAYPIYAPLVVSDPTAAELIRHQPHVAEAIDHYSRVTKALVAVGSWDPPDSLLHAAMTPAERDRVHALGVRAETCARMLDGAGRPVATEWSDRVIGITVDQLRQVPEVIAVAGGRAKVAAIRAVLVGGVVTSLVTDAGVARALLERPPQPVTADTG